MDSQQKERLIREKAAQIQEELIGWAKEKWVVGPGEHLLFSLSMKSTPVVLQENSKFSSILDMKTEDFFTTARMMKADELSRHRVSPLGKSGCAPTVRDVICLGREGLLLIPGVSKRSIDLMADVLRSEGIALPECSEDYDFALRMMAKNRNNSR